MSTLQSVCLSSLCACQVRRLNISGFGLPQFADWNLVIFQTEDVHVKGVIVKNPSGGIGPCPQKDGQPCYGPNADGIDLVSVQRALVEEMDISAGDDCICIKSGENAPGRKVHRPTEAVLVRKMHLRSCSCPHVFHGMGDGCGGAKVGTEMSGGVFDVRFEDLIIDYAGIALKLSAPIPRGGSVLNITWQGIEIARAGMMIGIDVNLPNMSTPPPAEDIAAISNINILDINLVNISCCDGCVDYGCEGHNVGWLQAGNAPAGAIHGLVIQNVTAHSSSKDSAKLSWLCSAHGSIYGKASSVTPQLDCLASTFNDHLVEDQQVWSKSRRTLSTWIGIGTASTKGGMGGRDNTEALEWLEAHHSYISSLSVIGYGKPGRGNISGPIFNAKAASFGIDVYVLWGSDWSSFETEAAINSTVTKVLKMVKSGGYSGVDLDFEHPQTWGPEWPSKMQNATFTQELRSKCMYLYMNLPGFFTLYLVKARVRHTASYS